MRLEDLHDTETRQTDHATGGQKGAKLTQLGSLDPVALIQLSRVSGMGAIKYEPFNFLKGYDWSLSFDALMRHALLFWAGEDRDYCTAHEGESRDHPFREGCNGSGLPHMAHVAWMALSLVSFLERGIGTDNRPLPLEEADIVGCPFCRLFATTQADIDEHVAAVHPSKEISL